MWPLFSSSNQSDPLTSGASKTQHAVFLTLNFLSILSWLVNSFKSRNGNAESHDQQRPEGTRLRKEAKIYAIRSSHLVSWSFTVLWLLLF